MFSIGNDIVDLTLSSPVHKRFLCRICSQSEQLWVTNSGNPPAALWFCWAAKEAAYKAMKKLDAETLFSPIQFAVEWHADTLKPVMRGTVHYAGFDFRIRGECNGEMVHCIAL